jgi:hypothetical protein
LESIYGPIHADVLRHDNVRESEKGMERIREARLVDEDNILRTYALTFLTYDKNNDELVRIDDEIREGGSIGKTFRKHSYEVKKNVIDVFIIDIPKWMIDDFHVDTDKAKARLTEFYAKRKNQTPVIYGTVLEIYSPDFKDPEDGVNDFDKAQKNPLTGTLQSVGVPTDEIWERLDRAAKPDEWKDLDEKYSQAQKMSESIIQQIRDKITRYIEGT